jgi:hypothetical protein
MSNQDDLHKHLTDPKTIKQTAEGSMEKRQELIDRVDDNKRKIRSDV